MAADDYSKKKLIDDMGETLTDWSQKKIRERMAAHGATPDPDDWSRTQMFQDGVGISPSTTSSTTTTTSTTTTSTTTTATGSTSSSTSTSSTSSTTSTATLPFLLPLHDGPHGTGLDPLPLTWVPAPGPGHATMVDDGTLDPPSEADFLSAIGAPLTDQLVLGPVSTPGVYSAAQVTLRMISAVPGADVVHVDLYDVTGAPMTVPGPHVFANAGPTYENVTVVIPFVGPLPDVAISGGVIDLSYIPGPAGPLDVADVRIELL